VIFCYNLGSFAKKNGGWKRQWTLTPQKWRRKMGNERSDAYDDGRSRYAAMSVAATMVAVIVVMATLCVICYKAGYHKMLTSEKMRQLASELVFDARTKNGDVVEKSYMPEGGFTFDSDTMILSEFYKDTTNLDGTFYLYNNDGEFLWYFQEKYPEALYPSNEWTPDEVLTFYRDSPESWAYYESAYLGRGYFICLTPDYKHCFAVKDDEYGYGDEAATMGWLIIDGVYVTAIDEQTADSLEPDVLIAQYRAGDWDGSLLKSKDYGTTVSLSYDQAELSYSYQKRIYSPAQDPQGLAYDGYEDPWWYDDELAEKYGVDNPSELVYDFGFESRVQVECYPDLPDEFEVERIMDTETPPRLACTLDVLLNDGRLQRYSRTELLDEWDLSGMTRVSLDNKVMCYVAEPFSPDDEIYYLDDSKLFALKTGGEVSLMLEHVDAIDYGYSLRGSTILALEDGELRHYDMYEGEIGVLDRDVLELDFGEIMAYKKADGYHTLYRAYDDGEFGYGTLYLGDESLDYYVEYCKNLSQADWSGERR